MGPGVGSTWSRDDAFINIQNAIVVVVDVVCIGNAVTVCINTKVIAIVKVVRGWRGIAAIGRRIVIGIG